MPDAPQGYYAVNGRPFLSKMETFIYASNLVDPAITFHYYDQLWDAALQTYKFVPGTDLEKIYQQRAQQIRDTHDYVILNFSGGADSTCILETFLKNNIKLDEIFVKWPLKMLNSGKYTPDATDTRATNMLSEWDFSIKPKLDYVRQHHPEIKIVVDDWIDLAIDTQITEDLLFKQNHNFGIANYGWSEIVSKTGTKLNNQGRRVANIFGTDKPIVYHNPSNNTFSMLFLDLVLMTTGTQHAYGTVDKRTRVDFFWTPDFPEITLARAHAVAWHFKNNPELLPLINLSTRLAASPDQRGKMAYSTDRITNSVLYPSWDLNTFQVDKPNNLNKIYHPWFHYIYSAPEFSNNQNVLFRKLHDLSAGIKDQYKNIVNNQMVGLNVVPTKHFKLNI